MFEIGDKVVPHSKSVGWSIKDSIVYKRLMKGEVEYAYVVAIHDTHLSVSCNKTQSSGDKFLESDLTLYDGDGLRKAERW